MHGLQPNPWMVLPFVALLAAIALVPLVRADWWERHFGKVSFGLGAVTLSYYLVGLQAHERVLHTAVEYVSFIALIGSLYVVSGGIHINVKGEATPGVNVLFLAVGALLANLLGTTGASMLLIRPWLRMNKYRLTAHHVVFFIFVVSNVGGCLTPIGDPPLFLGYLKGVPFFWVIEHCLPMWAVGVGVLLAMFFAVDSVNFRRAPPEVRAAQTAHEQWRFQGLSNAFFLAVILGAVFLQDPPFLREALMLAAAVGSWFTTPKLVHQVNHFDFHPIREVAILFAGIFATMLPALDWLQANAAQFGRPSPALYYWGSGVLSSALDNAPTYLSFASAALGALSPPGGETIGVDELLADPLGNRLMVAISVGSVFFGANTYIGNGPNFMVKAIADRQDAHTPSFLGYVFRFTLPIMLPMLAIVWLLFFRT
jgi:Na+/H+ antiporter NhaD/arsenite permease-like protein